MELKDPSATAGGTSEKPWGAENVISPLGMPPLRQEAQRLFNSRHDETVRLTRSRVRSHEGRSSVTSARRLPCFRASWAALQHRILLPTQEPWPTPGARPPGGGTAAHSSIPAGKSQGQRSLADTVHGVTEPDAIERACDGIPAAL